MKSAGYWRKRSEQVLLEVERNANPYLNQLNALYRSTAEEIDSKIKKMFDTYRKDFTTAEAKRWLNETIPRAEYEKLRASLAGMTDKRLKKQTIMRLNAPAYRYRITRQQYIKQQILASLSVAADQEKRISTECYVNTLNHEYYRTMFEIQKGIGAAFSFAQLPQSTINRLLSARWYGRNFSASIWQNRGQVAEAAAKVITSGILAGQSIPDMSKSLLEKTYTSSMKNATRLVRTEVNYFSNQGALDSYKEADIEKYEYIATLDLRTSLMCQEHDGYTYLISEAVVGENYPPLHPYCRSTVAAVIDVPELERMNKRAARDLTTGKTIDIENMSYNQWKKRYGNGILTDINIEPLPITAKSVGAVKTVPSNLLPPDLQGKLRNEHKKLLMSVSGEPLGTEAGATYDLNMRQLNKVIGPDEAAKVRIPQEKVPYIAMHNHPTGGTFTHNDLWLFANDNNMMILTAVGNNGAVYAVEKTAEFSRKRFFAYYQEVLSRHSECLKTPEKYAEYINDLLIGVNKYGINYTART